MKIIPRNADLKNWSKLVPVDSDLLFFGKAARKLAERTAAPVLSAETARMQAWTLSNRSWYGYSLNKAAFAVILPRGGLETLDAEVIALLAAEQRRLGVPSLIRSKLLSRKLQGSFREAGEFRWITSESFRPLGRLDRISVMKSWLVQNEIHFYSSVSREKVPLQAMKLLKAVNMEKLLNTYSPFSGPNCLAASAAAITKKSKAATQWLHWEPLETLLRSRRYVSCGTVKPEPGDVLVFRKREVTVHSAFFLGQGLYFEKPGQDFYEPYRLERFTRWKAEWPGCSLVVYRPESVPVRTSRAHMGSVAP
jgi:hypothetical protein